MAITSTALPTFEEIVEKYSDFVYNVALRMTNDPTEAQDAVQDAFISAFKAYPKFRGDSAITTWLYRITVNAVLMKRRKDKKARETTSGGVEELDLPDMGDGPEKQAISSEARRKVQAAIAKLPPDMRMAVILRDIQGLSGEEAAETLGIEVSTLKTRLHRGRMKLRDLLKDYVDGE